MCFFKWQNYISKCFTRSICAYILHESVETKHVRGFTIKSYWRWIVTDNVNKLCVREKRICWAKPNIHLKSRACQGSNKLMRYLLTSWFNFMWGEGLLRNFGARVRLWSLEEDIVVLLCRQSCELEQAYLCLCHLSWNSCYVIQKIVNIVINHHVHIVAYVTVYILKYVKYIEC